MSQLSQYIKSGSQLAGTGKSVEQIVIGLPGSPSELIIYNGKIYVYDTAGQTLIDGGYITATALAAASVATNTLSLNNQRYINNVPFSATDYNTASWGAGSIVFSDGTIVNTNAGNTGNIVDTTFVYYNGTSANLQYTTSVSTAMSGSNVPLAILDPVGVSDGNCLITPFISVGTTIDADKIITGKISSSNGRTFFDLNNNRLQVSDQNTVRVIVGKMADGSYGIKASLPGYTADVDTDINHYALWATSDDAVDNVLIKEKTRGSVSVDASSYELISHGLGYIPFVLVFAEESAGTYVKCYGWDYMQYGFYFDVEDTNIWLGNETGSAVTFKYYIFYDRVSSGTYEEIFVHDHSAVTEDLTI